MPPLSAHSLYQSPYCPFCVKVRSALQAMQLEIEMVDTVRDPEARQALINGGGRSMVPCLRIDHEDGLVEWMYESDDIIDYFRDNFAQ